INKRSSMLTSTGQYKGFRLQIISTREREKAFNIKAELLTKYPEEKSYVLFQSPYFRVRIGNFVKREDAEKFRKILNKTYKNGVFIVEDVIDYIPPPDEEF
ncbi:MAG TPA: SPOR domain-containing protein, partial [Chitinophagaceae bacterium]|nr:SPOR domain-containing protein [Chitinophagaceae bacterium]